MIVPTITTLTIDALRSIPMGIREAGFAMGATKWQVIYKVVLPAARFGIVDAIVLGMGRAIGETMAVLMVVGNAPVIPDSVASPISTLTSQIALDMSCLLYTSSASFPISSSSRPRSTRSRRWSTSPRTTSRGR